MYNLPYPFQKSSHSCDCLKCTTWHWGKSGTEMFTVRRALPEPQKVLGNVRVSFSQFLNNELILCRKVA